MLHVTEDSDIDIYLYGLGAAETNLKVKHIHVIWKRNMTCVSAPMTVIRPPKTIDLMVEYQLRLHLLGLLQFSLC